MADDLVESFANLSTTCISDAMEGMNSLDPVIKPLKEGWKVAGRAFTVKLRAADNLMVLKAIAGAEPGDVLVIDGKGYLYNAVCGDFVIGLAKTLGLAGVIVDGAVRDIIAIKKMDFPVFCRGTTVAASGKSGAGEMNVPISCGGTAINPGDIVVGDADGVVLIPKPMAQKILVLARQKLERDLKRERKVLGDPEAVRRYIDEQIN